MFIELDCWDAETATAVRTDTKNTMNNEYKNFRRMVLFFPAPQNPTGQTVIYDQCK